MDREEDRKCSYDMLQSLKGELQQQFEAYKDAKPSPEKLKDLTKSLANLMQAEEAFYKTDDYSIF